MNGEILELYNKLHTDLETFKATMVERWNNHAARGDRIDVKITEIFKKLNDLPCGERKGFYNAVNKQLVAIWTLIFIIIGAIVKIAL